MNRRTMIASAPLAGAAMVSTQLVAEPIDDAEIWALVKEWEAQYKFVSEVSEDLADAEVDRLLAIERKLACVPAISGAAFAAKLLVLTSFGVFGLDGTASGLLAEAEKLSGLTEPGERCAAREPIRFGV